MSDLPDLSSTCLSQETDSLDPTSTELQPYNGSQNMKVMFSHRTTDIKSLAKFAQVEQSLLFQLSQKKLNSIKSALFKSGHWTIDTSCSLRQKIDDDCLLLATAGIDRHWVLLNHEHLKGMYDILIHQQTERGLEGPLKRGTAHTFPPQKPGEKAVTIVVAGDPDMTTRSIVMSTLAEQAGIDANKYASLNGEGVSAFVYNMRWDDIHSLNTGKLSKSLHAHMLALKEARLRDLSNNRNAYIQAFGHAEHVVGLQKLFLTFRSAPSRKKWLVARETMMLIDKHLVLRVEWLGSEKCPIYSAFESAYIGYRRGNCDWFIRNVFTGAQVWIPDLVIYQVGLFGFLQDEQSPYRFDIANYCATFDL